MKIYTSYNLREQRISSYISIPEPTVGILTQVIKHVVWVSQQDASEIKIINESNI